MKLNIKPDMELEFEEIGCKSKAKYFTCGCWYEVYCGFFDIYEARRFAEKIIEKEGDRVTVEIENLRVIVRHYCIDHCLPFLKPDPWK